MGKLRLNEEKKRSSKNSGIPNAAEGRLAIDILEQLWNQKNSGQN